MSQQNKLPSSSTQADHPPVKRKRGRPRKDEKAQPLAPLPSGDVKTIQHGKVDLSDDIDNDDMVGQVVSGVIEGSFDAGYFLSVRAGNINTLLRGVVFQPGLFTPITASNDVAPQVKMYTRREFPIRIFNSQCPVNGSMPQSEQKNEQSSAQITVPQSQSVSPFELANQCTTQLHTLFNNDSSGSLGGKNMPQMKCEIGLEKQSMPQFKHNRIVEHDRMMQEFDASTISGGPKLDVIGTKYVMLEIASEITADIFPRNEAVNQVQAQAVDSGLEQSELARDGLKKSPEHLELHQTQLLAPEPRPVTSEPISEPVNTTENSLSLKIDMPQTTQLELAENPVRDDEIN